MGAATQEHQRQWMRVNLRNEVFECEMIQTMFHERPKVIKRGPNAMATGASGMSSVASGTSSTASGMNSFSNNSQPKRSPNALPSSSIHVPVGFVRSPGTDKSEKLENSEKPEKQAAVKKNDANPLADKHRPCSFNDYCGQEDVVGPASLLRRLIVSDSMPSFILWGPPGCGKTTLALLAAQYTKRKFIRLSATNSGVAEIKNIATQAANLSRLTGQQTVVFLDEIHRFNKLQQDSLLPHVERGTITLIGATTENPSFEINGALLSRCKLVMLKALEKEALSNILVRTVEKEGMTMTDEGVSLLSEYSGGDGRRAMNALQLCLDYVRSSSDNSENDDKAGDPLGITIDTVKRVLKEGEATRFLHDRAGDSHYTLISALQKSVRGSNKDAAIYYLARLLEGGEKPTSVARRIVRMATEDIGYRR
eukprot:Selendium_serpulae@DN6277_c0_g1_i11.p1